MVDFCDLQNDVTAPTVTLIICTDTLPLCHARMHNSSMTGVYHELHPSPIETLHGP